MILGDNKEFTINDKLLTIYWAEGNTLKSNRDICYKPSIWVSISVTSNTLMGNIHNEINR